MIQFYPNDVVRDKQSGKEYEVSHVSTCGNIDLNVDGRSCFTPELASERLQLVRRADEPERPSDVPRCELTLPEGKTRWAYRGWKWRTENLRDIAFLHADGWGSAHAMAVGLESHYAEAVNDNDYQPPQLSETTNSSQVESKITVNRLTELYHKDLHDSNVAQIIGGYVVIQSMDIRLNPHHALALAELLIAASKEAQQ